MTTEDFQKKVLLELKEGKILYVLKGTIAEYVLVYPKGKHHGVKADWIDKILPMLTPGEAKDQHGNEIIALIYKEN